MISIIICSREKKRVSQLKKNIQDTIGAEFETIIIDNSENKHSITQAYNIGIDQSKFDYLCFIHEDIEFKTSNWGNILISHIDKNPQGIVGVAGGQIATKAPSSWSFVPQAQRKNFMQCGKLNTFPKNNVYETETAEVILLDGFFLSCKKEFITPIRFDDTMHGFHAYDADICLRSKANGGTNFVMYNLLIDHKSKGNPNRQWVESTKKTFEKWKHMLPIYTGTENINVSQIEQKNMIRFIRRMIKNGCSYADVVKDDFLSSLWKEINGGETITLKCKTFFYLLFRWTL